MHQITQPLIAKVLQPTDMNADWSAPHLSLNECLGNKGVSNSMEGLLQGSKHLQNFKKL